MKILHIITSLLTGGAETLMVDIVTDLQRQGHEVDVVLFDGEETPLKERLQASECKIICFSMKRSFYNPQYILRLIRLIRYYDIIHTHNSSPQLFTAIANIFVRKKIVTTEHSSNNRRRKQKIFYWIDKWMYSRYHRIICISDKAANNLRTYLKYSSDTISTIYNGIDIERFRKACPDTSLRTNDKCVIVMVAGFRYEKDQDTLIHTFAHLPQDKYELWLVGDGVRRQELEKLVDNLNLKKQVIFLGIKSNVAEILHAADIVVMSSHFEGLSLSSIEGMSVGKPFVASDVDGLHEITEGAGILFPEGDAKALASIIHHLSNDPDYYHHVANACLQRAQQYDIKKTILKYLQVYEELLHTHFKP